MRVRENPPPLTLRLFKRFVNRKSPVSTGFLGISSVFSGFSLFFGQNSRRQAQKRQAWSG
jgi:hypothetical protein